MAKFETQPKEEKELPIEGAADAYEENPDAEAESSAEGKKSIAERGAGMKSAAIEKGKGLWGRIKKGISKGIDFTIGLAHPDTIKDGAGAVKRAGTEVGRGFAAAGRDTWNEASETGRAIKEGAQKKYEALSARGHQAWENFSGRVSGAKNRFMDKIHNMRIERLQRKEDKKQEKLDKLMREKINPLKSRIDELRAKKDEIRKKLSGGSPEASYASAAL